MVSKRMTFLLLVLPAILNIIIGYIISGYAYMQAVSRGLSEKEIMVEILKTTYTWSFYWSILQIIFGTYVIKLMGGFDKFGKSFAVDKFRENIGHNIMLIIFLVIVSLGIIFTFQFLYPSIYGMSGEEYSQMWYEAIRGIPLWVKIYFIIVAPFTAGIFEEAIWRWYGIENLEKYYSVRKAIIIQAIAFGFWHGISLHTATTFLIGALYGYFYSRKRRLTEICIAHIITDIIGFGMAFWVTT
ncbi:MAG: lysostaphin resistance A-like protein [Candidatus Njordarchaeota archaeon]